MNKRIRFLPLLFLAVTLIIISADSATGQGAPAVFVPFIAGGPGPAPGPTGDNIAWGTVPTPNGGVDAGNRLNAVAVLSPTDIWAVGSWDFGVNIKPQVQHWNGSMWSSVPLPDGLDEAELLGVAAVSANDVWIVGGYASSGEALILHWDGTALSIVSHPNPGLYNRFYAVTAVSANDIWAVGEYANGGVSQTLTQHWNGSSWQVVPSATDPGSYTELLGVTAISSSDVWAVGSAGNAAFAIHWDGSEWEIVNTPSPGTSVELAAVSAVSSSDVWAVGDGSEGTLTLHWDGSQWSQVASPTPTGFFQTLNAVHALAANNVWAVGYYSQGSKWYTLIIHWDGADWNIVASPSLDHTINFLNGIDGTAADGLWAVGRGGGTLVTHWDGSSWSVTPSANQGTSENELADLAIINDEDMWAVGTADDESLAIHWDGSDWSLVPTPQLDNGIELNGVAAVSTNDVWAVGTVDNNGSIDFDTLTMHWNGSEWTIIPSPNGNPGSYNELHDVAAVSANDVWAVGEYWSEFSTHPLILHWDGQSWSIVPQNCAVDNRLFAITVVAPDDIWATGYHLTCHYDGSAWTMVPSPQPRPSYGEVAYTLKDIDAVAADDIWIVGNRIIDFGEYVVTSPLAEHWDGTQWTAYYNHFPILGNGVVAQAADDVWAVGSHIAHWDGHSWTIVPSPVVGTARILNAIGAVSDNELWAAGYFLNDDSTAQTLIENTPSETQGTVKGDTNYSGSVISWFGAVSGSTEANQFGEYAVAGLPAGEYTFIASAPFCTPAVADVTITAGFTISQDFELDC